MLHGLLHFRDPHRTLVYGDARYANVLLCSSFSLSSLQQRGLSFKVDGNTEASVAAWQHDKFSETVVDEEDIQISSSFGNNGKARRSVFHPGRLQQLRGPGPIRATVALPTTTGGSSVRIRKNIARASSGGHLRLDNLPTGVSHSFILVIYRPCGNLCSLCQQMMEGYGPVSESSFSGNGIATITFRDTASAIAAVQNLNNLRVDGTPCVPMYLDLFCSRQADKGVSLLEHRLFLHIPYEDSCDPSATNQQFIARRPRSLLR